MPDDMNVSIRRWRDALACGESINTEKLDELQDHLEAELQQIPKQGLNDEERVLLAARRTGSLHQLEREYFDADPSYVWRRRVLWMIVGVFVLVKVPQMLWGVLMPLMLLQKHPAVQIPNHVIGVGLIFGLCMIWGGCFYLLQRLMRGKPICPGVLLWIKLHSGRAIIVFLLTLFVSILIREFTTVWSVQFSRPTDLGYMAMVQAFGAAASGLVIPIAFACTAWACIRRPSVA